MNSPPLEWAMGIAHLVALDFVRDHGDPDGDTLTEVLRDVFHVDTTTGRRALAVAIGVGGLALYTHLVKGTS